MSELKGIFEKLNGIEGEILATNAHLEATQNLLKKELEDCKKQTENFLLQLDKIFGAVDQRIEEARKAIKGI